jgi:hypothetical protein
VLPDVLARCAQERRHQTRRRRKAAGCKPCERHDGAFAPGFIFAAFCVLTVSTSPKCKRIWGTKAVSQSSKYLRPGRRSCLKEKILKETILKAEDLEIAAAVKLSKARCALHSVKLMSSCLKAQQVSTQN